MVAGKYGSTTWYPILPALTVLGHSHAVNNCLNNSRRGVSDCMNNTSSTQTIPDFPPQLQALQLSLMVTTLDLKLFIVRCVKHCLPDTRCRPHRKYYDYQDGHQLQKPTQEFIHEMVPLILPRRRASNTSMSATIKL